MIKKAVEIATRDLRACYGEQGIFAGLHQFKNYWARDSFFASLGSLKLKDYEIVKSNLQLYLKNTKQSGQIPFRVGPNMVLKHLGIESKNAILYENDKSKKKSVDQNSLLIISFYNYIKETKDNDFLKKHIDTVEKIILWNFTQDADKDLLIEESPYCNWADSVKKKGTVLYSNVCHCYALYCLSELFKLSMNKEKAKHYRNTYEKVKENINRDFWTGEYYLDWINKEKKKDYFCTDGNVLSIIWNIASKKQANIIENNLVKFKLDTVPSQCVYPKYPKHFAFLPLRLIGLGDYHNGLSWLWLGSVRTLAAYRTGNTKRAKELLEKIAEVIVKHKQVYEVYTQDGKPVKRTLYKAEHPFAWSSGLFVHAVKEIIK